MTVQPNPSVAEYDVSITFDAITRRSDRPAFVIARFTNNDNDYSAGSRGSNGPWEMWKRVAGVDVKLGEYAAAPVAGDVIKFEIRDGTKKLFVNGVERISSTNNELTSAGKAGIGSGDAWSQGAGSDADDTWALDDFLVEPA
jgi:hypothetical protein